MYAAVRPSVSASVCLLVPLLELCYVWFGSASCQASICCCTVAHTGTLLAHVSLLLTIQAIKAVLDSGAPVSIKKLLMLLDTASQGTAHGKPLALSRWVCGAHNAGASLPAHAAAVCICSSSSFSCSIPLLTCAFLETVLGVEVLIARQASAAVQQLIWLTAWLMQVSSSRQ